MENVLGANGQQLPNNHNHFDASSQVKHAIHCSNFISLLFFRNLKTRNLKHFLLLNGRAHMWDAMSDAFNPQFSLFILKASNILSPLDSQHHQSFSDLLFIFLLIFFSPSSLSFLQQHSKTCVPFACHAPHHTFDGWSYEWVTAERTSFKIHSLRLQQAAAVQKKIATKISLRFRCFYAVAIRYISPLLLPMYWLFNLKTEYKKKPSLTLQFEYVYEIMKTKCNFNALEWF